MKKLITYFLNLIFCLFLVCSCTIHFKAKQLELDAKPPEAKIGNKIRTNTTYELSKIDIFKNADSQNNRAP